MNKHGILIVAYGLGSEKAESSFADFCLLAKRKFQPLNVRHAFTSDLSRDRLAKRGRKSDSVIKALQKMVFEKYTHIYIQSLHLIPGIEYRALIREVKKMMNTYPVFIDVAKPLLLEENLYADMTNALALKLSTLCKVHEHNFKEGNLLHPIDAIDKDKECICSKKDYNKIALVFMAHGTKKHKKDLQINSYDMLRENSEIMNIAIEDLSADALYVRFAKSLQEYDSRIYLACMKGSLAYDELVASLKKQGVERVALFPFLSLLGSHTLDDMAGDDANSWKSLLIKDGFACEAHCISLLQTNEFIKFWLQSLENLINEYEKIKEII